MLEQVREAGAARSFVFGADAKREIDDDVGQPMVFVQDDGEAVGQDVALERYVERGGEQKGGEERCWQERKRLAYRPLQATQCTFERIDERLRNLAAGFFSRGMC